MKVGGKYFIITTKDIISMWIVVNLIPRSSTKVKHRITLDVKQGGLGWHNYDGLMSRKHTVFSKGVPVMGTVNSRLTDTLLTVNCC